jgi:hypothetical protein
MATNFATKYQEHIDRFLMAEVVLNTVVPEDSFRGTVRRKKLKDLPEYEHDNLTPWMALNYTVIGCFISLVGIGLHLLGII